MTRPLVGAELEAETTLSTPLLARARLVTLVGLAAVGCDDYDLANHHQPPNGTEPAILVEPTRLEFWQVDVGDSAASTFAIRSVGGAPLEVDSIALSGDPSFSIDDPSPFTLDEGESLDVPVTFAPGQTGELTAVATIASNDPEHPTVDVTLVGDGGGPWLEIIPPTWDFGTLDVPCGSSIELTLQNVGTAPLDIDSSTFDAENGIVLRDAPPGPLTLVPGAFTTAWVDFTAGDGAATGELAVASNDPRGTVTASQTGAGAYVGGAVDDWVAPTDPPVDLLFAVDQSCSMDDDAVALGTNFSAFIAALDTVTTGWHVGVVTLDDGCFNSGVLTVATPAYDAVFQDAVVLGDDWTVDDAERLFQLVDRALGQTVPGGCNDGFLRAGSPLHVIFVSDEPEQSTDEAALWTWSWFLPRFQGWVAAPTLFKASGVVDLDPCNEGAEGYTEMIDATFGEKLSICSGDWAQYAVQLAQASLTTVWTVPLSQPADPASITVTVNGAPATTGWTYDAYQNAVVFTTLTAGAAVEVRYGVAATCP